MILTQSVRFPFITWKLEAHPNFWFDEYKEDRKYLDDGTFGLVKKGSYLLELASTRTDIKTVADLKGNTVDVTVLLDEGDMGKVIGKQGRIAKALRTVVKAAAVKQNKKVIVEIVS